MRDEDTLKKMLYAYNYYDKWYRIDYKGVALSELMFFYRRHPLQWHDGVCADGPAPDGAGGTEGYKPDGDLLQ